MNGLRRRPSALAENGHRPLIPLRQGAGPVYNLELAIPMASVPNQPQNRNGLYPAVRFAPGLSPGQTQVQSWYTAHA